MLTHVRHRPRRRAASKTAIPSAASPAAPPPLVVDLGDDAATAVNVAGAKATNLALAAKAGLPVLDGVVLTEQLCDAIASAGAARELNGKVAAALASAWERVGSGQSRVVVRSSSRAEDGARSSLAGQFTSVLDVRTYADFVAAVGDVVRSADVIALDDAMAYRAPMAVLVQPQLDAVAGGVMFGVDPVSGRADRLVVAAVDGGPDRLVSGLESGTTHVLTHRGRLVSVEDGTGGRRLPGPLRRRLARLAADVAYTFRGPQDVEWAVDAAGSLWLLQSRPVTATAVPPTKASTRVLGPGPVAETFPDPLSPLEQDLWLAPLTAGLTEALALAGLASRRRLYATPPLVAVEGRAAVDLDMLGARPRRRSLWSRLDPVPPARRLRAAWRTGRLRAALPALGADVVARTDAELASVPAATMLSLRQLVAVLDGSHQALVSLHGYEILTGLLATNASSTSGEAAAGRALHVLMEGRAAGQTDAEIVAADPVVLSLVPPAVRPSTRLPATSPTGVQFRANSRRSTAHSSDLGDPGDLGEVREALRVRVRWLHELTAVVAWELGTRLHAAGALPAAGAVRWLRLDELRATASGAAPPADLEARRQQPAAVPLPAAFRLGADGRVLPVEAERGGDRGQGAGGGRAAGTVYAGDDVPPAGAVLVVRTLDPTLATVLPHLGGIVAETGSVLSHLAILAREFGVPTVVGLQGAVERFPAGTELVIDGTTGEVSVA